MKILYLSCHEILEYDEIKLFTELGYQIYSLGAYTMPGGQENRKRPPLVDLPYDPHFIELATRYNQDNLHQEMLDMVDMVMIMHVPEWIEKNWPLLKGFIDKGGRVVWRSIGQSVPHQERQLKPFRDQGLQIVRYSPKEATIQDYIGEDAMIRFGKDPAEYCGWNGSKEQVINFTQSMLQRGKFCGWDTINRATKIFPTKIYGPGNEDLGDLAGGLLSFEDQKQALRDARCYIYSGTFPASYTLSFIEALMTGIPVVSVGPGLGNGPDFGRQKTYEIHELISNGVDGYWSDDVDELSAYIHEMLTRPVQAQKIGAAGRQTAIKLFGIDTIKKQWQEFLG